MSNLTKVEFRELQRGVAYLRRMAEELVDECCAFETDLQELFEKRGHRKDRNNRYAPLVAQADVTDEELDGMTPEMRRNLGYNPEPMKTGDKNSA